MFILYTRPTIRELIQQTVLFVFLSKSESTDAGALASETRNSCISFYNNISDLFRGTSVRSKYNILFIEYHFTLQVEYG